MVKLLNWFRNEVRLYKLGKAQGRVSATRGIGCF